MSGSFKTQFLTTNEGKWSENNERKSNDVYSDEKQFFLRNKRI